MTNTENTEKNVEAEEKVASEQKNLEEQNKDQMNSEDHEDSDKKEKKEKDDILEKLKKAGKDDLIRSYIKILKENERYKRDLKTKEAEISEYLDKYKRALADMENLRKRMIAEKQDSLKYANFNIIGDLLVLLDDFQRAIDSAKGDENMDLKHFVNGVEMIEKQFVDLLFKKYGVMKYCEEGDRFDPAIHLAMMMEEGDFKEEVVAEVFRKGYKLHDRVIRASEVKVGKPKQ